MSMNLVFDIAIRPLDGLRHLDVSPDVAHELALKVGHRGEDAPVDHLALDLGKPDLHLVQPRGIRRREVELHFGIRLQESFHGGRLVRRKVVQDDVNFTGPTGAAHQTREELHELGTGWPGWRRVKLCDSGDLVSGPAPKSHSLGCASPTASDELFQVPARPALISV